MSVLLELKPLLDPYILGAGLACAVCAFGMVAALRALPGTRDPVAERLGQARGSACAGGSPFWTYRVTEVRD